MREFSVFGLLVLMACGSGIKLPETIPVTPDVPAPFLPTEAPPETRVGRVQRNGRPVPRSLRPIGLWASASGPSPVSMPWW